MQREAVVPVRPRKWHRSAFSHGGYRKSARNLIHWALQCSAEVNLLASPAPQHAGHGQHAGSLLPHARDRHPILWLKLLVLRLSLHVHALRDLVLHFRFETARAF